MGIGDWGLGIGDWGLGVINPEFDNNVILLVFIGGITYSEIAAIRYLNKSEQYSKYKFLIITTHVINGKTFFDSIKSDQIELALDIEEEQPKVREEEIDPKLLKKLKEKEEKEAKKKEKEELAKQKELEERQKEIERDRAEYREKKKKDNK